MNKPGLSRKRVLHAAVELVDRDGLDALSMRRLGEELGVEAMSLYRHVRNKGDLLDGIHECILREMPAPTLGGDWREDMRMLARALRSVLNRHPNALPLFSSRPVLAPGSMHLVELMLGMFREAGFAAGDALSAVEAVISLVVGQSLVALTPEQDPEHPIAHDLPYLDSVAEALADHDPEQAFAFGVDVLLRGLDSRRSLGVEDLIRDIV